jgi:hypothetical protein
MKSDGARLRSRVPLPPYAVCRQCRETASAALLVGQDGWVVCVNCLDTTHPRRLCSVCAKLLPTQLHHVASRVRYPTFTTPLCLACHSVLYPRQYRWRHDGSAERHPFRYLLVGVLDMVRLFLERSPAADACRQFFLMLAHAALLALGALQVCALAEVGHTLTATEGSFSW